MPVERGPVAVTSSAIASFLSPFTQTCYLRLTLASTPRRPCKRSYRLTVLDAIDIILIHQLIGRYGHLIDRRQWDRFGDLFLSDATIDYRSSSGRVERAGRDPVVAWFRELQDSHPPAHHVTNIIVDEQADPAGHVDGDSKFLAPYTRVNHDQKRLYGGE